jgi:transposase
MKEVASIGLDIAKDVFQLHGADEQGTPQFNRKLRRAEVLPFFEKLPPCKVGIEACSTAHYWARSIAAYGHDVRLIHPAYVKPFVKRGKTDANDAEAINEALTRKTMPFVPMKSAGQQAATIIFRTRTLLVRQRAQAISALRSHLAELGIVTARGQASFKLLVDFVNGQEAEQLPDAARNAFRQIIGHIEGLQARINELDQEMRGVAKIDDTMRRLMTIPGVGRVVAAAIRTFVTDPTSFKSARHFAAWIGLTPKSHSSGSTQMMGSISKMGNTHLRARLVTGGMAVLRSTKSEDNSKVWLNSLKARRPFKVAAVAVANKIARIVWALLVKGGAYHRPIGVSSLGDVKA